MSRLANFKGPQVQGRRLNIATYAVSDQQILVEGELSDERMQTTYLFSGEKLPPKIYHNMVIRLLISGPALTIEDLEVEMPAAPREACLETRQMLGGLKGMRIAPGFTAKVKRLWGGAKGCAHLVSLLLTMAPAAVQGFWAQMSRQHANVVAQAPHMSHYLKNTCWVWREEGPLMTTFLEELEQANLD